MYDKGLYDFSQQDVSQQNPTLTLILNLTLASALMLTLVSIREFIFEIISRPYFSAVGTKSLDPHTILIPECNMTFINAKGRFMKVFI